MPEPSIETPREGIATDRTPVERHLHDVPTATPSPLERLGYRRLAEPFEHHGLEDGAGDDCPPGAGRATVVRDGGRAGLISAEDLRRIRRVAATGRVKRCQGRAPGREP